MGAPRTPGTPGTPSGGESAGHYVALLEAALTARQEAVLAVERLLAGPHTPAELARARQRVESLAAASEALLAQFERVVGVRPTHHSPP
jgi:hypothetical protein